MAPSNLDSGRSLRNVRENSRSQAVLVNLIDVFLDYLLFWIKGVRLSLVFVGCNFISLSLDS